MTAYLPALLAYSPPVQSGGFMDCSGASMCGVISLENGLGAGNYKHDIPSVHGLWPETGSYGNSPCTKPTGSSADPTKVYPCYATTGGASSDQLSFEVHEWGKHGECAGVKDADTFFSQVCSLSSGPVGVMTKTRSAGSTAINDYMSALTQAGYPVWSSLADTGEVQLSVCAGSDAVWKVAKQSDFASVCGGGTPSPPGPAPAPATKCIPDQHGPSCSSDADCTKVPSCVRCAHSGFCTTAPGA